MEHGRPPELGNLVQVIPAEQSQRRGVWTVTLSSIERWDNCFVATFDVVQDEPIDHLALQLPGLEIEAVDQDGAQYRTWFGGGYGGGLVSGGQHVRVVRKFTPPLPAETTSLRFSTRLRLTRSGGEHAPREAVVWEDPTPWNFDVDLAARPSDDAGVGRPHPEQEPDSAPGAGITLPSLRTLQRVIPVAQERESAGWRFTAIAAELYEDGFQLTFRILGPDKPDGMLQPGLGVTDDRGRNYRTLPGAGNGEPTFDRCHWRMAFECWPALDPDCSELRIQIDELQFLGFEPLPTDPTRGKGVVRSSVPGDWSFVVDLA